MKSVLAVSFARTKRRLSCSALDHTSQLLVCFKSHLHVVEQGSRSAASSSNPFAWAAFSVCVIHNPLPSVYRRFLRVLRSAGRARGRRPDGGGMLRGVLGPRLGTAGHQTRGLRTGGAVTSPRRAEVLRAAARRVAVCACGSVLVQVSSASCNNVPSTEGFSWRRIDWFMDLLVD